MKLKVLIVEDEYYFRQTLKKYMTEYEREFEVCGEARNGRDGLDLLMNLRPDVALVDITMPLMDGITLIREATGRGCVTKFIILTGYSEFDYARQAIQLGVQDYLLKPLGSEELYQSLCKVRASVEQEHEARNTLQTLSDGTEKMRSLVREGIVRKLLVGEHLEPEEQATVPAESTFFCAGVFDISLKNGADWKTDDYALWNYAVSNILREFISPSVTCDTCYNEEKMLCALFSCQNVEKLGAAFSVAMGRLCEEAEGLLNLTVSVFLGTIRSVREEIRESYAEALSIQKYQLFGRKPGVYFYAGNCGHRNMTKSFFSSSDRRTMMALLYSGDTQKMQEFIDGIFRRMGEDGLDSDTVYIHVMDMISVILDFSTKQKLDLPDPNENPSLFSRLFSLQSLNQLQQFVCGAATRAMEQASGCHESVQKNLVERVTKYIDQNYANPNLKLEVIAGAFYINIQYLCTVFKQHRGMTIGNYLLYVRMENAKQAFEEGAKSITSVAQNCGYEDISYFSKCFKRYFGVSPRHYRGKL